MKRPDPDEYAEYYANYIARIPGTDILGVLEEQRLRMLQWMQNRSERDGEFRYAPGKWTLKEVLGHINDTERIFAYRALRIGRGDATPLPSFDQDDYVRSGAFAQRRLVDVTEEFAAVRAASLALYRSFDEAVFSRRGVANGKEVTVRALAFMTGGHQIHHMQILEERYLPSLPSATWA